MSSTLPTYFISHGGGPWPFLHDDYGAAYARLGEALAAIPAALPDAPRAVLVVSGHWEEPELAVMAHSAPPMLYDYYGFPPHTYDVKYPAPGEPELARRVQALLERAGFAARLDAERGYDHGAFVPLAVMYPRADVPVIQLSLHTSLDPAAHLLIGAALAPLRAEGVLILGSGMSYHNLRLMGPGAAAPSRLFDAWLEETLAAPASERCRRLLRWQEAPAARIAHPREEHLLPLHVAVGAAGVDAASLIYHEDDLLGTMAVSSYRFG
ncbi:MAG TPA: class III extradiol ring-cleavage dioxygenase [Gammaproteobacteria bacterium]